MRLVILTPHFAPDVAPTGELATLLVEGLAARGHTVEVVTALPWYRAHAVEPEWAGRLVRHEDAPWGHITRIHPFPASDKRALLRRAAAFSGFSLIAAAFAARGPAAHGVLAISPPLTLALSGLVAARRRRAPFVFNVQDVYPDAAVAVGAIGEGPTARAAARLERFSYARADAVTVLSDDIRGHVAARGGRRVETVPNFVDPARIVPGERENSYRREFGLTGKVVVMYAGNVGLSQPFDLVLRAAATMTDRDDVVFVVNGGGAAHDDLVRRAAPLPNVRFVEPQPAARLPEVLAAADIHLVLLKSGLGRVSVPSKTLSALAAARPVVAAVDAGTEVTRILEAGGAGIAVDPSDPEGFAKAVARLVDDRDERERMGAAGRRWIERAPSRDEVAARYEELFKELRKA